MTPPGRARTAAPTGPDRATGDQANHVVALGRVAVVKSYTEQWRQTTEARALRMLRRTEAAPRLLAAGTWRGRPVTVMTRVGGVAPSPAPQEHEAVELLRRIHRMPVAGRRIGRLSDTGAPASWPGYLARRIASYRGAFRRLGLPEPERACDAVGRDIDHLPPGPWALLHNDPHRGNFLGHGARLRLIDWELAIIGDPVLDLVRFCWEWCLPAHRWPEVTGLDHDHPRVRAYRGVHSLSRLMAAVSAAPGGKAALAERCLRELTDLGHCPPGTATHVRARTLP